MPITDEEKRRIRVRKGLKKEIARLVDSLKRLRYSTEDALETGLDGVYERPEWYQLEVYKSNFHSVFLRFEDVFLSVEILEDKDPKKFGDRFYREENLFSLMQDLGLIENYKSYMEIHETLEYMTSRIFSEDMTTFIKKLMGLAEVFFKDGPNIRKLVPSKYMEPGTYKDSDFDHYDERDYPEEDD